MPMCLVNFDAAWLSARLIAGLLSIVHVDGNGSLDELSRDALDNVYDP